MSKSSAETSAKLVAAVSFDTLEGARGSLVVGRARDVVTIWLGQEGTDGVGVAIDWATAHKLIDALTDAVRPLA